MILKGVDMISGTSQPVRTPPSSRGRIEFLWAWTSVAVMMALLVATFIASESMAQIVSQILGPLTVVASLGAVWLGLAARRHGEEGGLIPAAIGALVGGFFLVMVLLALIFHFGVGWE
jgi:FtsH-binding integral membrane protein